MVESRDGAEAAKWALIQVRESHDFVVVDASGLSHSHHMGGTQGDKFQLCYFGENELLVRKPISREPVDAGAHEEVSAQV